MKRSNPTKMTIFNLYIFDEKGSIIYYKEWLRKKHTSMEKDEVRSAGIGKWVFNDFVQGGPSKTSHQGAPRKPPYRGLPAQ